MSDLNKERVLDKEYVGQLFGPGNYKGWRLTGRFIGCFFIGADLREADLSGKFTDCRFFFSQLPERKRKQLRKRRQ